MIIEGRGLTGEGLTIEIPYQEDSRSDVLYVRVNVTEDGIRFQHSDSLGVAGLKALRDALNAAEIVFKYGIQCEEPIFARRRA